MKQMSSAQIRQMWLDFWASKGHSVEPLFLKIHALPMRKKRFVQTTLKT